MAAEILLAGLRPSAAHLIRATGALDYLPVLLDRQTAVDVLRNAAGRLIADDFGRPRAVRNTVVLSVLRARAFDVDPLGPYRANALCRRDVEDDPRLRDWLPLGPLDAPAHRLDRILRLSGYAQGVSEVRAPRPVFLAAVWAAAHAPAADVSAYDTAANERDVLDVQAFAQSSGAEVIAATYEVGGPRAALEALEGWRHAASWSAPWRPVRIVSPRA